MTADRRARPEPAAARHGRRVAVRHERCRTRPRAHDITRFQTDALLPYQTHAPIPCPASSGRAMAPRKRRSCFRTPASTVLLHGLPAPYGSRLDRAAAQPRRLPRKAANLALEGYRPAAVGTISHGTSRIFCAGAVAGPSGRRHKAAFVAAVMEVLPARGGFPRLPACASRSSTTTSTSTTSWWMKRTTTRSPGS